MPAISDGIRGLDDLEDCPYNYNRHSETTIRLLADTILSVGFTKPVVINTAGMLLAGHRTKLALMLLREEGHAEPEGIGDGWRVPVRIVDASELTQKKIIVSDNPDPARIDYSAEALTALLGQLSAQDALDGSGYDQARMEELLGELSGSGGDSGGRSNEPPEDFPEFDEQIETEHLCPRCGYAFSGGKTTVPSAVDDGDRSDPVEREEGGIDV